jgi:SET domain
MATPEAKSYYMSAASSAITTSGSLMFWTGAVNPPVQLVDMSHLQKGFGLIASRSIQQGQVVFTERVPTASIIAMPTSRDAITHSSTKHCQLCHSSMEPASSFFDTAGGGSQCCLPLSHLWPNQEYNQHFEVAFRGNYNDMEQEAQEDTASSVSRNMDTTRAAAKVEEEGEKGRNNITTTTSTNIINDEHGRVLCTVCKALFCSTACHESFLAEILPNCCQYQELAEAILDVVLQYHDPLDAEACLYHHWEVVMACRIFCSRLTHLRRPLDTATSNYSCTMLAQAMEGMCGDTQDLTRLQVGVLFHGQMQRTVEPFYHAICRTLSMTCQEKQILSLAVLERLASVCSRNSLQVIPASPLTIYHDCVNQQLASQSVDRAETIRRDMKRAVAQLVTKSHMAMEPMEFGTVPCCAVLPLFSRLNHSCEFNLQVMDRSIGPNDDGQDAASPLSSTRKRLAVDLIATRNIGEGEELTICYLSPSAATLAEPQRNKRLQSRYLFTCHCSRCTREREPAASMS